MFIKNKYYNKYRDIVRQARIANRTKGDVYYESHHVLPKSVYPQYRLNKRNLVLLTAKEHFVCHHLLSKCVLDKHKPGMTLALWRMVHAEQHSQRITAKVYQVIREQVSLQAKQRMAENHPKGFKGRRHTDKTLRLIFEASKKSNAKQSEKAIDRIKKLLQDHNFTFVKKEGKHVSVKCDMCSSITCKTQQYYTASKFDNNMCKTCNPRKPMTAEHRAKIAEGNRGKVVSAETRKKLSDYNKAKHRKAK